MDRSRIGGPGNVEGVYLRSVQMIAQGTQKLRKPTVHLRMGRGLNSPLFLGLVIKT
jgi:hypothetical protein